MADQIKPGNSKVSATQKKVPASRNKNSKARSRVAPKPLTADDLFDQVEERQLAQLQEPLLPWLIPEFKKLLELQQRDRLPHALLLQGAAGIGKHNFAAHLAAFLLCQNTQEHSTAPWHCGHCASCQQYRSRNHPDYRHIHPTRTKTKAASTYIRIDDIRDSMEFLQLTNQYNGKKVALIDRADNMNIAAANSLLKSLEEPSTGTIFILIADNLSQIPATIISRCRRVNLQLESPAVVREWLLERGIADPDVALRVAGNSPLAALALSSNTDKDNRQRLLTVYCNIVQGRASIAKSVEQIIDIPTHECLSLFLSFTADVMKCGAGACQECRHIDFQEDFKTLFPFIKNVSWLTIYDQLLELHRIDSVSFKIQPVLETVFAVIRLEQS